MRMGRSVPVEARWYSASEGATGADEGQDVLFMQISVVNK